MVAIAPTASPPSSTPRLASCCSQGDLGDCMERSTAVTQLVQASRSQFEPHRKLGRMLRLKVISGSIALRYSGTSLWRQRLDRRWDAHSRDG